VRCKWVFKKKLRADATIEKYNLWLKIYPKRKTKIKISDTYPHMARPTTTQGLLLLFASYGLLAHQMNVKTTFLNKELDRKITYNSLMVSY
jgi:hypothetical protein